MYKENHVLSAAKIVRQLMALTDEGEASCHDDGCRVLFGIIRDCAFKCKKEIELQYGNILPLDFWQGNTKK